MFSSKTVLLLCSAISTTLATASCPAPTTCKGLSASVASALKTYSVAQSWCSQKYPVPAQTCTSTAPVSTVTYIAGTSVGTTTVSTVSVTVTPSTITSTATITETPALAVTLDVETTVTNVVTSTATATTTIFVKRDGMLTMRSADPAAPTYVIYLEKNSISKSLVTDAAITARAVDPKASQLSSLQKQASSFVGGVCTCLEVRRTTTVTTTPLTTLTATATITTSVTATSTGTATATVWTTVTVTAPYSTVTLTSTVTIPSTTIVTNTATSTASKVPIPSTVPCGQAVLNSNGFTVRYTCGARRSSRGQLKGTFSSPSAQSCADEIRAGGDVFGLDYDFTTSMCTTYQYPCLADDCAAGASYSDHFIITPADSFVFIDVAGVESPPTYA